MGGGNGESDVLPDSPEPIAGGGEAALGPLTRAIVRTEGDSSCGKTTPHRRQQCLAHVKRHAEAMQEPEGKNARIGAPLLNDLEFVLLQHARMCRGEITRATMWDSIQKHARWWIRELPQHGKSRTVSEPQRRAAS